MTSQKQSSFWHSIHNNQHFNLSYNQETNWCWSKNNAELWITLKAEY